MRYNLIKINDTYLTHDGTSVGEVSISELPDLLKMRIAPRNVEEDLNGGQHVQFGEFAGFNVEISIAGLPKVDLDALLAEINQVEADGNFHNLVVVGETGNFDLNCALITIANSGEVFNSQTVRAITFVFRVDSMNEYVAPEP